MNHRPVVFASNNANKLAELRRLLQGTAVRILSLEDIGCHDDIPETADTFRGNALQKARYVLDKYGYACFADDSGLEVDALGGAPGVRSARYASESGHDAEANNALLLKNLDGITDRRARFRTSIALVAPSLPQPLYFDGVVEGTILDAPRGEGGFGYDPLFMPLGWDKTFAEASPEEKNQISHRGNAVRQLIGWLQQHDLQ